MDSKNKNNEKTRSSNETHFGEEDGVLIGFHKGRQSELDSVLGAAVRKYIESGNPATVAVHTLTTLAAETAFGTYGRTYPLAPMITIFKAILYQLEQRTPESFTENLDLEE